MVEAIRRAWREARAEGRRPLFIYDHRFIPDVAKVSIAGHLRLVTATKQWWDRFIHEALASKGLVDVDPKLVEFKTFGIPILPLSAYQNDHDWPVIMEAIIRLKLIDETAVFR